MNRQNICLYLILISLTVGVYWQIHAHEFISADDTGYITMNANVQKGLTFENIIWAFTSRQESNWHPLTWLSHMLDFQLFGPDSGSHHLINLLMHILNTCLLFALFKKITSHVWPSFLVALLFALHPAHIESVAWAAERKDVLSTLFFTLTLLAYINYVRQQAKLRYVLVLLFFTLGLMAKPMLVTLPFVLLLLDYWPLNRIYSGHAKHQKAQRSFGYLIWEKLPLFALSAVSSLITFYVQKSGGAVAPQDRLPFDIRFLNAIVSYGKYVAEFLWPAKLAFFYPYPSLPLPVWQIVASIIVLLGITIVILKFHKQKYLAVGWLWFLGTLVPVIGLVQVGGQALADRYTYIPYIGLSIIIAWVLTNLAQRKQYVKFVLVPAVSILVIVMSTYTYFQIGNWNNSISLYSHALEVTQRNYVAHHLLADPLYRQGRIKEATEHLAEAIKIRPDFAKAHNDLAVAYFAQGNSQEALKQYYEAIKLDPDMAIAHSNLGAALLSQQKYKEALGHIKRSLELESDNLAAKNNLAWILASSPDPNIRNPSEAIHLAQEACLATDYNEPGVLDTLGAAYASAGRFDEAVQAAQKAMTLVYRQDSMYETIRSHLALYKISKPCIAAQRSEAGTIK